MAYNYDELNEKYCVLPSPSDCEPQFQPRPSSSHIERDSSFKYQDNPAQYHSHRSQSPASPCDECSPELHKIHQCLDTLSKQLQDLQSQRCSCARRPPASPSQPPSGGKCSWCSKAKAAVGGWLKKRASLKLGKSLRRRQSERDLSADSVGSFESSESRGSSDSFNGQSSLSPEGPSGAKELLGNGLQEMPTISAMVAGELHDSDAAIWELDATVTGSWHTGMPIAPCRPTILSQPVELSGQSPMLLPKDTFGPSSITPTQFASYVPVAVSPVTPERSSTDVSMWSGTSVSLGDHSFVSPQSSFSTNSATSLSQISTNPSQLDPGVPWFADDTSASPGGIDDEGTNDLPPWEVTQGVEIVSTQISEATAFGSFIEGVDCAGSTISRWSGQSLAVPCTSQPFIGSYSSSISATSVPTSSVQGVPTWGGRFGRPLDNASYLPLGDHCIAQGGPSPWGFPQPLKLANANKTIDSSSHHLSSAHPPTIHTSGEQYATNLATQGATLPPFAPTGSYYQISPVSRNPPIRLPQPEAIATREWGLRPNIQAGTEIGRFHEGANFGGSPPRPPQLSGNSPTAHEGAGTKVRGLERFRHGQPTHCVPCNKSFHGPGQQKKLDKHERTDRHWRKTRQETSGRSRWHCGRRNQDGSLCKKGYNRADNLTQHHRKRHGPDGP
ncbi:hypothetical protein B0T25DRAFT_103166 [Lasiosphaeria hispida]|uniref:C2H2-type domain-containing protein n=1 Tax=Lasiosphaeria hispida TaxID=260671 RepID=A0AAJ0HQH5_9PEZI|nr:hypothetical protein B0T25DRAFT_103166 [Lasiosphaeria hispida]